jgi:hypothetical protein
MKNLRYLALSALLVGGLYSCKKDAVRESDQEKPSTEIPQVPVDYTKYVSIGNSLTAGYADGGLYHDAQTMSFPAIIASKIGDATFSQPDMSDAGSGYMYYNPLSPSPGQAYPDADWLAYGMATTPDEQLAALMALPKAKMPVSNIGVPGIRAVDMGLPGYGAVNPYMGRMVDNAELGSKKYVDILQDNVVDATFFTFWLGNNDVLGFATSGGVYGEMGDVNSPAYRMNGLPDLSIFALNYEFMTDLLVEKRGIMSTIPPVTVAPFFTYVGPQVHAAVNGNPNYILDDNQAAVLNEIYAAAGYTSSDENPIFIKGQNFPIIKTGPGGQMLVRQLNIDLINGGDFVLLTFGTETAKLETEGLGLINVPGYPNEYDYVVSLATLKVIGEALEGIQPLVDLVANLKQLSGLGLGGLTLDQAVGASGGQFTQEQADAIKAGLKTLGFTDAQLDVMTIDQIIGATDKAPEVVKPLLVVILMQQGMDQATAEATANAMTIDDTKATLEAAQIATNNAMVAAATAAGLDPTDPTGSMITASERLANPIETKWVLDKGEEELVTNKTKELNDYISISVASNPNWMLINSGDLLESANNTTIDGVFFTLNYISGNMFSMDGIHLTPHGYGIIAKEMVNRMNADWQQSLPAVDVSTYGGIKTQEGRVTF